MYAIHIQFCDHRIFQSNMSEVSKSHFLSLSSLNIDISGEFFMTNFNFLIKEYSNQKQKPSELSKTHNIPIKNGTTIHYTIHHSPIMTQS